ncbi:MAG: SDR family NAD(P)-dependent oxidoreductase [Chlorobi bacterium]|nr:SDR family NAD(P)-dependent oxidoreductase [Chlorobiota bacterium]
MSTQSEAVVVTGAGGFIGSHLVAALVRQGKKVRAMVRYTSRGDIGNLAWNDPALLREVEIVRGDIRDTEFVRRLIEGTEVVYHLAAAISIPYSYTNPREFIETNINGTLNILAAVKNSQHVRRVVITSTSEVFGTAQYVPMNEKHPLHPQSPYAATKVGADQLSKSFGYSFDVPVIIARPFNTFGPRQSPRAVIPTIILQALAGNTIRLGRMDSTRDFLYVGDTVRGFLACGDAPAEMNGEEFNFGTGVETTIHGVRDEILQLMHQPAETNVEQRRLRPESSEVMRLLCDSRKANQRLNWFPETSLTEGLQNTVLWFTENRYSFAQENNLI